MWAVEALVGIRKINCHPVTFLSCYLRAIKTSHLVILISIPQSTTPLLFHYQKMYILTNIQTKGQLISKCLFGIFNSPKKRTKKLDFTTYYLEYLKQNCFRSFLAELKTPKRHFEINWPLVKWLNIARRAVVKIFLRVIYQISYG